MITQILEKDALRESTESFLDYSRLRKFSAITEEVLTSAKNPKSILSFDYNTQINNMIEINRHTDAFQLLYKHKRLDLLGRENSETLERFTKILDAIKKAELESSRFPDVIEYRIVEDFVSFENAFNRKDFECLRKTSSNLLNMIGGLGTQNQGVPQVSVEIS